ncbi:hypothetical protein BDF19DRAFT_280684 [Syncephalis fuscata]|nr:hypothetical protein BDF19DRAFT_280684 [Syncephalis fuscata]
MYGKNSSDARRLVKTYGKRTHRIVNIANSWDKVEQLEREGKLAVAVKPLEPCSAEERNTQSRDLQLNSAPVKASTDNRSTISNTTSNELVEQKKNRAHINLNRSATSSTDRSSKYTTNVLQSTSKDQITNRILSTDCNSLSKLNNNEDDVKVSVIRSKNAPQSSNDDFKLSKSTSSKQNATNRRTGSRRIKPTIDHNNELMQVLLNYWIYVNKENQHHLNHF